MYILRHCEEAKPTRQSRATVCCPRLLRYARNDGFTLVELSIVLVILGLLVGGVLAGQNLIRAAEQRKVITDIENYKVALMGFREKYFAIPGDIGNATAFWGKDATACNSHSGTAATDGTCNGNDNGQIMGVVL